MRKTAIILHGAPGKEEYFDCNAPAQSNHHWLPWLQKQLLVRGYEAQTPEIPESYKPEYSIWKREFERFEVNETSLLVGHSCGAGFLVRWLSENPQVRVDKVVLVAPWLDPNRSRTTDFFEFDIDPELAARSNIFAVFNSDNDGQSIKSSAYSIRDTVKNCRFREFHNYGHFCVQDLHSHAFVELLDLLLS